MPRIQETVEQVAAASDIVAVISSYFPLKRAGTEFRAHLSISSGENAFVLR